VVAELLREKLARQLGAELPYATHVVIDAWEDRPEVTWIEATIWVEKPGQKAIVIGSGGKRIKALGQAARIDIERLLGRQIYLKTWVKVKGKWTEDPAVLERLGGRDGL
jgi:GTP-binding protein Era